MEKIVHVFVKLLDINAYHPFVSSSPLSGGFARLSAAREPQPQNTENNT